MNLAQLLTRAASAHGQRPAIYCGSQEVLNYAQLAQRVARLAGGLHRRGLRPGDRVALILRNCPEYIELMFACWHAGLVVVPVNAKLHVKEFCYVLEHSGARGTFISPSLCQAVMAEKDSLPALEWLEVPGSDGYQHLCEGVPLPLAEVSADEVAWLFYTSGTTGRPKGAMLSHRNLMAMTLRYFSDVDSISPDDCIIHAAPLSHGSGLFMLPHVAAAASQVIPESGGFDADEILELIGVHSGVSFFAAPTMVSRLVHHPGVGDFDFSQLKTIIYGGGPMYLADCKDALAVFGNRLAQIYGQGESPMTITALAKHYYAETSHPRYEERLASVGVPHTGIEVRVADADGRPLPIGETGEVLVRGDTVMLGYWANPEASAEALRDGWLHTGDLGSFDEEGFLTLKDRNKDVIISGGTNIYPREIEETLLREPRLLEVACVGRPHPDWGEEVVVFCVATDERPSTEELDELCLAHIARFKRPKEYIFVDMLPKNSYGKVLKTELRRRLTAAPTSLEV